MLSTRTQDELHSLSSATPKYPSVVHTGAPIIDSQGDNNLIDEHKVQGYVWKM